MKKTLPILAVLIALFTLSACEESNRTREAAKAEEAANSIVFAENAEIENIKRRLQLTANPGLLGFVVLLNETGQPVMYTGIKGKITSGGKRLNNPMYHMPSDEGTYGSSGEYVFFWTTNDQYIQWNGKYLYSDKPFRLNIQPIVVTQQ
ncbi:MAG: hypothetical protein ACRDAM_05125 [Casimicrobium sp.]